MHTFLSYTKCGGIKQYAMMFVNCNLNRCTCSWSAIIYGTRPCERSGLREEIHGDTVENSKNKSADCIYYKSDCINQQRAR